MAVNPPFSISETLPANTDLISIWPSQENPFRDTVESWLTFLSDPTTGQLKATAFAFPFSITNAGTGTFFELISTDPGATEGPSVSLYRNSASPAAADVMGVLRWYGKDSAGNKQEYGHIRTDIADPVSTTEDGTMRMVISVAGALTEMMTISAAGTTIGGTTTVSALVSSGAISGTTGTFSSTVTGVNGTFSGNVTANQNVQSSTAALVLGSNGAGTVYLRPNGAGSATGQLYVTSSGSVVTANTITVTGSVSATANVFAAGSVFEGGNGVILQSGNGTPNTLYLRPTANSATGQFYVLTNGNANASGDLTASSDRRLKKSIAPLNHMWANDMVAAVEPKSFIRKKSDTRSIGFIADDVEPYAPELVGRDPNGLRTLAYPNLVAILWAVVQDLQKKVAILEAK